MHQSIWGLILPAWALGALETAVMGLIQPRCIDRGAGSTVAWTAEESGVVALAEVAGKSPTNLAQKDGCFDCCHRYFRYHFRFRLCWCLPEVLLAPSVGPRKLNFDLKSLADQLVEWI